MPIKKALKVRAAAKKSAFTYERVPVPEGIVGKYYPADDIVLPKGPKPVRNAPKLRSSITPGTVLILVAGRFKGKRVVCLKQMTSGLLLVTGPYSVNGVPLRRVNQKYVIATSTKVGVDGVDVKSIDDAFFGRGKDEKKGDKTVSEARKSAQTKVDSALIKNIQKVDMMEAYLGAKFSLSNGDKPHLMQW